MKYKIVILLFSLISIYSCKPKDDGKVSEAEKLAIHKSIQHEIDTLILAVNTKNIALYMKKMPVDFVIYDNNGEIISREQQRENALRDWSIIDTTLNNKMIIDSIDFLSNDSIYVYTNQRWERIMFRRDGVTTDTVLTTQKHKELWKKKNQQWIGYDVKELGGKIYLNGKEYIPN